MPSKHDLHPALHPLWEQIRHLLHASQLSRDAVERLFKSPHLQVSSSADLSPTVVFNTFLRRLAESIERQSQSVPSDKQQQKKKPARRRRRQRSKQPVQQAALAVVMVPIQQYALAPSEEQPVEQYPEAEEEAAVAAPAVAVSAACAVAVADIAEEQPAPAPASRELQGAEPCVPPRSQGLPQRIVHADSSSSGGSSTSPAEASYPSSCSHAPYLASPATVEVASSPVATSRPPLALPSQRVYTRDDVIQLKLQLAYMLHAYVARFS